MNHHQIAKRFYHHGDGDRVVRVVWCAERGAEIIEYRGSTCGLDRSKTVWLFGGELNEIVRMIRAMTGAAQ
ncbi:MAG: hypothetical protein ACI88C_000007 [Acidimicrobiales bacterium]